MSMQPRDKPDATNDMPEQLEGERGIPSVNANKSSGGAPRWIAAVCFFGVVLSLATGVGFWAWRTKSSEPKAPEKSQAAANTLPAKSFEFAPPPPPGAAEVPAVAPVGAGPNPYAGRPPPTSNSGNRQERPPAELDKDASALMVVKGSGNGGTGANRSVPLQSSDGGAQGALAGLLGGTRTRGTAATFLQNRDFLLAKDTFIPCALRVRLDSTVPGITSCEITRDVYSDNGRVLLIERGSTVSGEYRSNMKQGMARIFVLWTRIKTTNGIIVALDSPGADSLGGAGIPGYVDTHFWERFGGAMMLSLVDDIAESLATSSSSSGQNINLGNSSDTAQDMAAEALKSTINIPPTLYANQGALVSIAVARDLDFGGVYALESE